MSERARTTFRIECWRAASSGVIESASHTLFLLIAVTGYQTGAWAKALIASGGSLGFLLTPILVAAISRSGWRAARAAAGLCVAGATALLPSSLLGGEGWFVVGAVFALAMSSSVIPLATQIFHDNYPAESRGSRFGVSVSIRIVAAAVSAYVGGRVLEIDPTYQRWLVFAVAIAFGHSAGCFLFHRSNPIEGMRPPHLLHSLRHLRTDRILRIAIGSWMLVGFGNLMMFPLRIDFLADGRFGIELSPGRIALIVGVIPNVARLLAVGVWGRLFDRLPVFGLRAGLNLLYLVAIGIFFSSTSEPGLMLGAALFGIASGGGDISWNLWVTRVAPKDRVVDYMATHTFFTGVRGLLAPIAGFHLLGIISLPVLTTTSCLMILTGSVVLLPEIRRESSAR